MRFARSRRARFAALIVFMVASVASVGLIGSTNITVASAGTPSGSGLRLGHGVAYPFLHTRDASTGESAAPQAATAANLKYYGGTPDPKKKIGVQVHPKIYLVFWGAQWGTPTQSGNNLTFTIDPLNAAPYVQNFLRGLYGSADTWSTSTTQYCQGITKGATTCPTTAT